LSGKGAVIYESIYNNRTNYDEPEKYPDSKKKVFTFPPLQDPEDEGVELKIISEVDNMNTFIRKNDDGTASIIFDKSKIPFDDELYKSSGCKETFEKTIWVSLTDSDGNVEYFFLKVVFNSPEESPSCNLTPSFKGGGIEGVYFS